MRGSYVSTLSVVFPRTRKRFWCHAIDFAMRFVVCVDSVLFAGEFIVYARSSIYFIVFIYHSKASDGSALRVVRGGDAWTVVVRDQSPRRRRPLRSNRRK